MHPWAPTIADLRPRVKEITDILRRNSDARIVLGGPGFNYYARDWFGIIFEPDYGICGEGEESFPLYLSDLAHTGGPLFCAGLPYSKKMTVTVLCLHAWSGI